MFSRRETFGLAALFAVAIVVQVGGLWYVANNLGLHAGNRGYPGARADALQPGFVDPDDGIGQACGTPSPTPGCEDSEDSGDPSVDVRSPTVTTPTPAACQVDTATPWVLPTWDPTGSPTQPPPQATATPAPASTGTPIQQPSPTAKDTERPDPTAVPSSTPKPEPTATDPPPPTEKPKCNRGLGNGAEGCDPGNSGGNPGGAGEGNE